MSTTESSAGALDAWFEAFARDDVGLLRELADADVVLRRGAEDEVVEGAQDVLGACRARLAQNALAPLLLRAADAYGVAVLAPGADVEAPALETWWFRFGERGVAEIWWH
jgi:hypothetical protein